MEIVDEKTKDKILDEVSTHLNIKYYYDHHELSSEEVLAKYGYWGIGFRNFREIRFYPQSDVLIQLIKLLSPVNEYFILPIDNSRKIYIGKPSLIVHLFKDQPKAHFTVVDKTFKWILIKDDYNKIIGIGDQIKKKILKMTHITFDNERIMYALSDSQSDNQANEELH